MKSVKFFRSGLNTSWDRCFIECSVALTLYIFWVEVNNCEYKRSID